MGTSVWISDEAKWLADKLVEVLKGQTFGKVNRSIVMEEAVRRLAAEYGIEYQENPPS